MASISAKNKPQTENKKKGMTMKHKDAIAGLLFILPAFISLAVFLMLFFLEKFFANFVKAILAASDGFSVYPHAVCEIGECNRCASECD